MNILYLIGNGFDLNLGLKTKFSNIAEKIIEEKTDDPDIKKLKKNIKRNKDLWWSDFELQFGEYTESFSSETINSYDNQYNYIVKIIKELFEIQENLIDYDNNMNNIAKSFMKYLTTFYDYLPPTDKQIILDSMNKMDVNENLFYDFITFNYTSVLDNFIKYSSLMYGDKQYSTQIPTTTPRNVKHLIGKIIHLHGTLADGLILGVDNEEQIKNKQLAKNNAFIHKIVKLEIIKILGLNCAVEARKLINNSNIIIAFGLSIGLTDKYWWNYIFEWLVKDKNRHFIVFIFNDKINSMLNIIKVDTIEKFKDKLVLILDNPLQKKYEIIKENIHIIYEQRDMFKIKNIFYPANFNNKKINVCPISWTFLF